MNTTMKVARYEGSNVLRSRWMMVYTLFFLAASYGPASAAPCKCLPNMVLATASSI